MSEKGSFKNNTILLTVGTIINKGLQFAVIPFFSSWLSTEEYGRFDLIVTYVSLLIPIITLSNQEGIFRMCVNEKDEMKKSGYITGGIVIDIFNYFFIVLVLFIFYGKNNRQLFWAFSLYLFGEVLLVYLRGVLRALKKLDVYSFILIFSTIIMILGVTLLVLKYKLGLKGIVIGYALGSIVGSIIIAIIVKWWKLFSILNIKISLLRDMLAYSIPLIPNDLSWWVINASDRQIINFFFGDNANGIYAIAHKIPAICSIIFGVVAISWQQEISVSVEEKEYVNINEYLNAMIKIISSFCMILLSGSFVLFFYIFDKKYFEAYQYSPILILSSAVLAISLFMGGILAAYKRSKSNGFSTIMGAVINVIVHFVLIGMVGLYAAAISTFVANIINLALRVFFLRDVYRIKVDKMATISILLTGYFFVAAYNNQNMIVNIINLLISVIISLLLNKELVKAFLKDRIKRMV